VAILREGKRFVAYTPALDLSTSGKTQAEAKARFQEAAELFFEELLIIRSREVYV
jgi:predicted RNase H-like HicB family nuclease